MKKIFIIEDDQDRIEFFRKVYKDYKIITTDNPEIGADILRREQDLAAIFMDHDLGGGAYKRGEHGDGVDLAKIMAEEGLHKNTTVIIHSLNYHGANNIFSHLENTHTRVAIIKYIEIVYMDQFDRLKLVNDQIE